MNTDHAWVDKATILRVEVGSGVHGIAQEGTDDIDHMGVCLEPYELAFGLHRTFEQYIYRDAEQRTGKHDAPSMPGDLDLTVYSLRKWIRLALNGNPTVLMLLFSPIIINAGDARGAKLREMAPLFASKQAGKRFLGYLQGQRQKLLGERGQMNINRRELVAQHGYDTKFAGHMIRLGLQGIEYLQTGKITLPMPDQHRQAVIDVRQGRWPMQEVLDWAVSLEDIVKDLLTTSPLPDGPNTDAVQDWMLNTYFEHWNAEWAHPRHMAVARDIWARKAKV